MMMRVHARRQSEASSFTTQDGGMGDGSSASSTHSDDAMKLFAMAPWWVWCTRWHNPRPPTDPALNSSGSQQLEGYVFRPSGPSSSDEMMQLYRTKRLKGSVLLVGLTQAAKEQCTAEDVPANVYRTLAHLFEMSKNGVPYTPVGVDGIRNGMSAASWARPLWTISEPSLPSEKRRSHAEAEQAGAINGGGAQDEESNEATDSSSEDSRQQEDLAVKLLSSAPSWCYLYSHEPLKSKKTPPKSAAYMVEMYRAGCLPDWTPMLGLREEVAHFNSLPPSLFTPLSALVTVLKAGLELQPVGPVELQRYDKFIESRTHSGITMRTPNSEKLHSNSHTPGHVTPTRPTKAQTPDRSSTADTLSSTLHNLPPLSKSASGKGQGTANGSTSPGVWTPTHAGTDHDSYSMSARDSMSQQQAMMQHMGKYHAMGPTWMTWGNFPDHSYSYLSMSPASSPARGIDHTSSSPAPSSRRAPGSPGAPGGRVSPAHRLATNSGSSQKGYKQHHHGSPPGHGMHGMVPSMHDHYGPGGIWGGWSHYPPPMAPSAPTFTWTTPVFKLFMADVSRGSSMPAWWYLPPEAESDASPVGPVGCEAMIMMYAHGSLTDQHLVCGTHADVTLACPPGREFFEELTKLLQQVQQGGQYMLVSLAEVTQQPGRSYSGGDSKQGGYQNGAVWHKAAQNGDVAGNGARSRAHHAGLANGHVSSKQQGGKGTNHFLMSSIGLALAGTQLRPGGEEPGSPPASGSPSQSEEGLGSPFVSRHVAAAAVADAGDAVQVATQSSGMELQGATQATSDPQMRDQAPKGLPVKEALMKADELAQGGFGSTEIHIPEAAEDDVRETLDSRLCSCAGLTSTPSDTPNTAACNGTPLPAA